MKGEEEEEAGEEGEEARLKGRRRGLEATIFLPTEFHEVALETHWRNKPSARFNWPRE